MQKWTIRSINQPFRPLSLWLLAAAICLCPAAAGAGTLGSGDTATGTGALANENGGNYNTANGYNTLNQNTTGTYNTASGYYALYLNTTGISNTASGAFALYHNNGYYNTASGVAALESNTTGNSNVAFGHQALNANTGGNSNTAVGDGALSALTGSNNIALGINAGKFTTSGHYNIYIGHPGVSGSESNVTRIGKAQTKTFVAGIAGVPLSGATVVVKANGQLGVVASSVRYKQDIEPLGSASSDVADKLARLRPVSYRYKAEPEAAHYGLIAEEVDKVMPELVIRDGDDRPESVQYVELIPLLLQQWKAQQTEIARQRELIERQGAELTELRRTLATRLATLDGENTAGRR